MLVDLLGAALVAGATVVQAIDAVTTVLPGPTSEQLSRVQAALMLGATPDVAWESLRADPELRAVAAVLARADRTGARASESLAELAADLRTARRAAASRAAHAVGVRAVLPLGVCFLPAFVLVGVVPTVVGLASGLWSGLR